MLVVTTDYLPGYQVTAVIGEVVGVTARTHNPFSEGVRALTGTLNPRVSEALVYWRQEAVEHMMTAARRRGANAIIGMRFTHREINSYWVELCAYGTAVRVDAEPAVAGLAPGPAGGVTPARPGVLAVDAERPADGSATGS